jgi:HK97 family phage prohead protease
MIEPPERRFFEAPMQLRDTQLVGKPFKYLEGRAVPYDEWAQIGWFLEAHAKGSLDQTTTAGTGKQLPLLLFHNNRSWPVGHAEQWSSTEDGLHGVWRLNDTSDAQQAATLANAGDLGYLSIGFAPIRSEWQYLPDDMYNPDLGPDHMDRVTRLESRLLEVSLTPTPAFASAEISMVRSAERSRPRGLSRVDGWRRELEKLRR